MSSISQLLPDAADIRDASQEGENTAVRVGTLFADMINAVDAEFDAANAQILRNTGQAVFLGTPLINTTDAAMTISGVSVAAKSVYFPASNVVVNGSTGVYHPEAQTVALTAENLSWSLWVVLFDKSNATFDAIPSSQFSGNLNANKYFYAVIRLGSAGASGVGVLRINSFTYKLNGNTEYRNEMPSDLPSTVATHSTTLASHGTAISGLQSDVANKASASDLAALAGRVTTAEGKITANTAAIKRTYREAYYIGTPEITLDPVNDRVTISFAGHATSPMVYINGGGGYKIDPAGVTASYDQYSTQYLIFSTAASETDTGVYSGTAESPSYVEGFKFVRADQFTELADGQYMYGLIRIWEGQSHLTYNEGVFRLNSFTYIADGVEYTTRMPADIIDDLDGKQDALVSGTNIKTINQQSLLGAGNITIGSGSLSPVNRYAIYPKSSDQLRVLCIGNSFTADTLQYVGKTYSTNTLIKHLLTAEQQGKLMIGALVRSAETISNWRSILSGGTVAPSGDNTNGWAEAMHIGANVTGIQWTNNDSNTPYAQYVAQPWDVIMIQQASGSAADYTSYAELAQYIKLIRSLCTNKYVSIVWNMPWATEAQSDWTGNAANAQKVMGDYGIGIVVPSGTVVENLKANINANFRYWSTDGTHLWNGAAARYAVGCAFWEAVMKPWCGVGVRNDTSTLTDTGHDASQNAPQVTDNNRDDLKICALCAIDNWLNTAPINNVV